jgi:intein-encoded DNA endonuclease-like protein
MTRDYSKSLRPLDQRKELFEKVSSLRASGLSYNEIIKGVAESEGVVLSKSHVSAWLNGKHHPDGSVTKFEPAPSFELGYVAGVALGDGTTSISSDHNYAIKLQVNDKEFAEEFARCLGVILHRPPPNVRWYEARRAWRTQVSSLLLLQFLRQPTTALSATIMQNEDCSRGFVRGFFDSEGGVYEGTISAVNTDRTLVESVKAMLNNLGIATNPIGTRFVKGQSVMIRGKMYRANNDCFRISVRSLSRRRFLEKVGFAITRKNDALKRLFGHHKASNNALSIR